MGQKITTLLTLLYSSYIIIRVGKWIKDIFQQIRRGSN